MVADPPLSVRDWQSLPEIVVPVLKDETGKGSVYKVYKVGFVLVASLACKNVGIRATTKLAEKWVLPTAAIEFQSQLQTCRLPIPFSEWVVSTVGVADGGVNPLPSYVEFGIIRGRYYAEIGDYI